MALSGQTLSIIAAAHTNSAQRSAYTCCLTRSVCRNFIDPFYSILVSLCWLTCHDHEVHRSLALSTPVTCSSNSSPTQTHPHAYLRERKRAWLVGALAHTFMCDPAWFDCIKKWFLFSISFARSFLLSFPPVMRHRFAIVFYSHDCRVQTAKNRLLSNALNQRKEWCDKANEKKKIRKTLIQ